MSEPLLLPAVVVAHLDIGSSAHDRSESATELIDGGRRLLLADDRGVTGQAHGLAMATGDLLFYSARLALTQLRVRALVDEVWDLEERFYGQRSTAPPWETPEAPQALTELPLTSVEDSNDCLEWLCYGIGERDAAATPSAEQFGCLREAMAGFAAVKFALFTAYKTIQVLEFRRAGLMGSLDSRRRRDELLAAHRPGP